jgi:adenosylhomocysteine nucleosidase
MKHRIVGLALCLLVCGSPAGSGEAREPTTGVLGAMGGEVRLLLNLLEGKQEQTIEGIRFWTGRLKGRRVAIAMTGVGKVNAAIAATLLREHFRPAEVLFTGIAGGLNPELKPGDIVIAEKTVQHDYGTLTAAGFRRKGARNPIDGQRNPTFLPADPRLVAAAMAAKDRVALDPIVTRDGERRPRVLKGIVATGDVFVALPAKKDELRRDLGADAVEMEGAAVAQVCWQWRVPCLVIRSLSDLADHNAIRDAKQFQHRAARNSAMLVADIVEHLE